jgi:hypothetical protein
MSDAAENVAEAEAGEIEAAPALETPAEAMEAPEPAKEDKDAPHTPNEPEIDEALMQQALEDEEIRIAMEMAIAAAKNPHMPVDELRKLVNAQETPQGKIVKEIQSKRIEATRKAQEEAAQEWDAKKERAYNWWQGTKQAATDKATELKHAAERRAEELRDQQARRVYAEDIKADPGYQELRKKIKTLNKTIKAHRLQVNRVDTRHVFKRQRQEKELLKIVDKLQKTQRSFVAKGFNIHEYAKAMMKASKKWKKKGSDEELALEAQLCRNMHQMLALEKQVRSACCESIAHRHKGVCVCIVKPTVQLGFRLR